MRRPVVSTLAVAAGFFMLSAMTIEARKPVVPHGILALSSGNEVVLIQPGSDSEVVSLETGPVGFLFPAPGGVLFAPDVVNDRTNVIDIKAARTGELISGVTMPHFGPWADRYLVVAGALTMVSYPERSLIFRMDGSFDRPWQVQLGPEGTTVLILERTPSGKGGTTISAVDLGNRRVIYTKHFDHDLEHFFIAPGVGLLAVVDRSAGDIALLNSKTLGEMRRLTVPNGATDVVVLKGGRQLVASGADGLLMRWDLKAKDDGLEIKADDPIDVAGRTTRLVVGPEGRLLAAATDEGFLVLIDSKRGETLRQWKIPTPIRDLKWIDSDRRGPILPSWSDRGFGPEGVKLGARK